MFMPASASAADPRHALPESAYQLQRSVAALRDHASNAQQVLTLPATLAHVHETLDLLAVGIQRMAQAVADSCGADGRNVDEDTASPRGTCVALASWDHSRGALRLTRRVFGERCMGSPTPRRAARHRRGHGASDGT
jgi:hypothetical protein